MKAFAMAMTIMLGIWFCTYIIIAFSIWSVSFKEVFAVMGIVGRFWYAALNAVIFFIFLLAAHKTNYTTIQENDDHLSQRIVDEINRKVGDSVFRRVKVESNSNQTEWLITITSNSQFDIL